MVLPSFFLEHPTTNPTYPSPHRHPILQRPMSPPPTRKPPYVPPPATYQPPTRTETHK